MDSRLSVTLTSIFLVLSFCLLGYMSMTTFASPTPTSGLIGIDSSAEFKQSDSISYWFENDAYVNRLELTPNYIDLNSSVRMSVSASSGHLNITLVDWNMTDNRIAFDTQQYLAHVTITISVLNLPRWGIYGVYVNGTKMASIASSTGSMTYNYESSTEWRGFEVVMSPYSSRLNMILVLTFLVVDIGVALTVYNQIIHKPSKLKKPLTIGDIVLCVFTVVVVTALLAIMYGLVA